MRAGPLLNLLFALPRLNVPAAARAPAAAAAALTLADCLIDRVVRLDLLEVRADVLAVDEAHYAVDAEVVCNARVLHKRRHHRSGVGHSGRLEQHEVKILAAILEVDERLDEVAAHRAASAPVVERHHLPSTREANSAL